MLNKILIYQDEGAHPACIRSLVLSLRQENFHNLSFISRRDFQNERWKKGADLLVFPGGRDTPYHQALAGAANRQIRQFVEEGGRYLGICAGAYYGSRMIEFEKGQPLEILAKRELAFFPGVASGPAYGLGQFRYENDQGARIARLDLSPKRSVGVFFNGGCAFVGASQYPNVQVIASYQDIEGEPAAIIQCQVGKGVALLSGVHPEYSSEHLLTNDPYLLRLLPLLKEVENERKSLFRNILKRLLQMA